MNFDEWHEAFKPIKNEIDENASYDGEMFETFGDELQKVDGADPKCVWTLVEGDNENQFVINGFHFVNRLGYFITEKPYKDSSELEISVGDEADTKPSI